MSHQMPGINYHTAARHSPDPSPYARSIDLEERESEEEET